MSQFPLIRERISKDQARSVGLLPPGPGVGHRRPVATPPEGPSLPAPPAETNGFASPGVSCHPVARMGYGGGAGTTHSQKPTAKGTSAGTSRHRLKWTCARQLKEKLDHACATPPITAVPFASVPPGPRCRHGPSGCRCRDRLVRARQFSWPFLCLGPDDLEFRQCRLQQPGRAGHHPQRRVAALLGRLFSRALRDADPRPVPLQPEPDLAALA